MSGEGVAKAKSVAKPGHWNLRPQSHGRLRHAAYSSSELGLLAQMRQALCVEGTRDTLQKQPRTAGSPCRVTWLC